jgi:hypothetical protein
MFSYTRVPVRSLEDGLNYLDDTHRNIPEVHVTVCRVDAALDIFRALPAERQRNFEMFASTFSNLELLRSTLAVLMEEMSLSSSSATHAGSTTVAGDWGSAQEGDSMHSWMPGRKRRCL